MLCMYVKMFGKFIQIFLIFFGHYDLKNRVKKPCLTSSLHVIIESVTRASSVVLHGEYINYYNFFENTNT